MSPSLPAARGPLSTAVIDFLAGGRSLTDAVPLVASVGDVLTDDDLHLALWCAYELHHHGFVGVDDGLEWSPELIGFRSHVEHAFEAALRSEHHDGSLPVEPVMALRVIGERAAPPLAATLEESGTLDHLREFAIHRSAYQLKEADAHTFAIPRLRGAGRAAMVEIQADEYGWGRRGEAHCDLFAEAMRELGLPDEFGHLIDLLPGTTLATDNLVEMFGLHRRLRGALVGHLALFESTSVTPMSRYMEAARRIGGLPAVERFYEVHVEADVHHGHLATTQMVTGILEHEPHLAADVVFGASALQRVESRFARRILESWEDGRSSLLAPPSPDLSAAMRRDVPALGSPSSARSGLRPSA